MSRQTSLFNYKFSSKNTNKSPSLPPQPTKKGRVATQKEYETKRQRHFQNHWLEQFEGLKYDENNNIMSCEICREWPRIADQSSSLFIGCSSMRIENLKSHWATKPHAYCIIARGHARAIAAGNRVEGPMDVAIRDLNAANKTILEHLFNTIYFVWKHEMPFTTLPSLMSLQKKNGSSLRKLESYCNDQACRRLGKYIADDIRDGVLKKINDAAVFSLCYDGATDCSVSEVEIIYVRLFDKETAEPKSYYFKIVDIEHAHAEGVYEAISNAFDILGVQNWKDKLAGAGSDGAKVNIGRRNSVSTRIRDENHQYIMIIHCVAHRLELSVLSVIKDNNNMKTVTDILHKMYKHYHFSPKALRELRDIAQAMEAKIIKPTRLSGTRWTPHMSKALATLTTSYTVVLAHFEHVSQGQTGTAEVNGRATFLSNKLKDFRVLRFIFFMRDLLEIVSILSLEFQKDNLTAAGVLDALETANLSLIQLTQTSGANLQRFLDQINEGKYKGVKLNHVPNNIQDGLDAYSNIVESVREHINNRIEDDQDVALDILRACRIFEVNEWPRNRQDLANFGNPQVQVLSQHFAPLLRMQCDQDTLQREWTELKAHLGAQVLQNQPLRYANQVYVENVGGDRFKNILMLFEISQVLPMSSANCERGFSAVKRIKSDWRASLDTDMLDRLLLVSIEGPTLEQYDAMRALDRWWHGGQRARRPQFVNNIQGNDNDGEDRLLQYLVEFNDNV